MKVITCVEDAVAAIGQLLGVGEWKIIDQQRIDSFADVTEDHQWIHLDAVRAAAESPYGGTVAHGFLTLSLLPKLSKDTFRVENARMGINYGLNKVRFLAPVTAGSRIRVRSNLLSADRIDDRTVNLTVRHTVEVEGSDTPAAVADLIARYVF
ncbi:MaoC family dehydratase [soil metagenome]